MEAVCPICQSTDLAELNGVMVCNFCGTQTQTLVEETEWQHGVHNTRNIRTVRTAEPAAAAMDIDEQERVAQAKAEDVSLLYCQCLQKLVQDQAQALSKQLGINEQAAAVMRQLWLSHIAVTGILEPDWHRRQKGGKHPIRRRSAAGGDDVDQADSSDSENEQSVDAEADDETAVITNPNKLHLALWRILPPRDTLVIAFLACLHLREAVTPMDIARWALDGDLPFLDLPSRSKALLAAKQGVPLPAQALQASLADPPVAFLRRVASMAESVGLPLALVNGLPLLQRAVLDLQLPKVVGSVAAELHRLYQLDTPLMSIHPDDQMPARAHPYVTLMATIVVALKLLYGIDGGRARGQVAGGLPGVEWQAWAAALARRLPVISGFPLTQSQVLALSGDLRRAYLQHCQHNVFDGFKPPAAFQEFQQMLLGFLKDDRVESRQQASGEVAPEAVPQCTVHPAGSSAASTEDYADDAYSLASANDRATPDYAAVLCACAMYAHVTPARLNALVRYLEQQMLVVETAVQKAITA